GQTATLCRDVLDQVSARRRRRGHRANLQGTRIETWLRLRCLGLADRVRRDDRDLTELYRRRALRRRPTTNRDFIGRSGMARLFARIRTIAAAFGLLILIIGPPSSPVFAQVDPNASAVQEKQLLDKLKTIQGLGTIPDTKSYVLEHPAGRDWQYFHNVTLRWIAAIAILGFLAVLVIFYLVRGSVKLESGFSGRKIVRFNWFERAVHWMTAVCFIILGITGLNITFGRPLLLPWICAEQFTAWSEWAKYAHNYLSFPFTISVVLIALIWIA